MRAADHLVDFGPGPGVRGGEVVADGLDRRPRRRPQEPHRPVPLGPQGDRGSRRRGSRRPAARSRSSAHGRTTSRTSTSRSPWACSSASPGVSGSGKSSLVNDILRDALARDLNGAIDRAGPARPDRGDRPARQGDRHRPVADRPHAALEPGDVHQAVRRDPRPLHQAARGQGPRLQGGPVQLQRHRRPLRGVRGQRLEPARDGLPGRRLGHLPGLRGQAVQPRDAASPVQGQEHRRRARDGRAGGARALREHPQDRRHAPDAARRRARLSEARPAVADALRRRGPADQAGPRAGQEGHRQDALHPRRADHRPALRRHPQAARSAPRLHRGGQHGGRDRAQPRRDQDGRLGHRPRPRRGRRRRPDRRRGHARSRSPQIAGSHTGAGPAAGPCRRRRPAGRRQGEEDRSPEAAQVVGGGARGDRRPRGAAAQPQGHRRRHPPRTR